MNLSKKAPDIKDDLEHIIKYAGDVLEEFRDKKVFITGGTGFFGIWILESLASANAKLNLNMEVVVLTRNIENFKRKASHIVSNKSFSFIEGDVKNFKYPRQKFNYIIHAATDSVIKYDNINSISAFDDIVEGTRHVLDFAINCEASNILYVSSGAVYGRQPANLSHVSEDYMGVPDLTSLKSVYAEAKRTAEMLCTLYSNKYNVPVKIARCFAFVGPYLPLDKHFAIGNFILNLTENKPIIIKGDGTPVRSYLYVSDLVIWLLTILIKGKNCYPYNVGSEEEVSIEKLAGIIVKYAKIPLDVEIKTKKSDLNIIDRYVPSTKRAQKELGLKQIIDLESSIYKTKLFAELLKSKSGD
jgi:nucleoside-diphosphate-sugar epimerase